MPELFPDNNGSNGNSNERAYGIGGWSGRNKMIDVFSLMLYTSYLNTYEEYNPIILYHKTMDLSIGIFIGWGLIRQLFIIKEGVIRLILPVILNSTGSLLKESYIEQLLKMNEKTAEYGLALTKENVGALIETRNEVLQNYGRIELGISATEGLISSFCSSAYINDENYVNTLNELHEIFYYLKNEMEDGIGDEPLISLMFDYFENSCGGSLELLRTMLESFAENFRRKAQRKDYYAKEE